MTLFRHMTALSIATLIAMAGLGCTEKSGGVHQIEASDLRTTTKGHPPVDVAMTSAKRFGFTKSSSTTPVAPAAPAFEWITPESWQILAPQPMRDLNFAAGDPPMTECYVSIMGSSGGGVAANVNRWRQQMGLAPESEETIDALPAINVLGFRGVLVELEGTYSGMRGDQQAEDSKLLAVFVPAGDSALTIKMIGPADQVNSERENFATFARSLKVRTAEAPTQTAATRETSGSTEHVSIGGLDFEVPSDWKRGGERPMRLATYALGATDEAECYISPLSGSGGGEEMNLNRWLNQMGHAPMSASALAALPKLNILGQSVSLLETGGTYTSMRGETKENYALAGVFITLEDTSYSIKLIGPQQDVAANRATFIAFCESLHVHH